MVDRVAIGEALMLLRRRRALSEVPIDGLTSQEEMTPALELADPGPDPETTYVEKEEARILSAAMRQLRPAARRTIELRELGELSTEETAGQLGVSVAAVKARVFQARRKLGKALSSQLRSRPISGNNISVLAHDAGRVSLARLTCVSD
jgi:RNA polymerase sigma-70 factor, ECF subfamily